MLLSTMRISSVAPLILAGLAPASSHAFAFVGPNGGRPPRPRPAAATTTTLSAGGGAPSSGLDSMTVKQLKALVKESNPPRGVLTKLKKKAAFIEYLENHVVVDTNDASAAPPAASDDGSSDVVEEAAAAEPPASASPAAAAAASSASSKKPKPTMVPVSGGSDDGGGDAPFEHVATTFPGALSNADLVNMIASTLDEAGGYDRATTLVATSLCCDEVNRPLESDFASKFDANNFNMGGLAGFPFGGTTAFEDMASHIPDGGSCLVVYGPHVGIDSNGVVGTVERRGRSSSDGGGGGPCCRSAVAAAEYVGSVFTGRTDAAPFPTSPVDAQQYFVGSMLLPYAERLEYSDEKMVELPYALYDAQTELMEEIVGGSGGAVAGDGTTAVLGGIQINTPPGFADYYLPLSFQLYSSDGAFVEDLWE